MSDHGAVGPSPITTTLLTGCYLLSADRSYVILYVLFLFYETGEFVQSSD